MDLVISLSQSTNNQITEQQNHMKVAIYGKYYLNSTEPIIKDIFVFFINNKVEMVIEHDFLMMLHEKEIIKKEYKTFTKLFDSSQLSYVFNADKLM